MRAIRESGAILAATLVAGAVVLAVPAPAVAQPGSADARAVVVDLSAEVSGDPVISADATILSATAPAGRGADLALRTDISLPGATGVTAQGTAGSLLAVRQAGSSSADADVPVLALDVLGSRTLDAVDVGVLANCPYVGAQTATTRFRQIRLFATVVDPAVNGPSVDASAPVTVPGLLDATLHAALSSTETTTGAGASVAILATFTLTGTAAGSPVTIPVGTVIVARASCERPGMPPAPTVTGLSPSSGPQSGGQYVTVTGSNFIYQQTSVTVDGVPVEAVDVGPDESSLTFVTPAHPIGTASVVVTTPGGSTPPVTYSYLPDGSDATVTGLTPDTGPSFGGTTVTITGTNLTDAVGVIFDQVPGTNFTVDPAGTTISIVTPPGDAGPASISVVFPAGYAYAGSFSYLGPTITSIVPAEGPAVGGSTVTITGTGLAGATGVNFASRAGTDLVVNPSGTSLTVVTPPGFPGPTVVRVLLPGADAISVDGFSYLRVPPTATAITPASGRQLGYEDFTVTGTNLVPGLTTVSFDGEPAMNVWVAPDGRSLTGSTPTRPIGPATVLVRTPSGTTAPLEFTYLADGSMVRDARLSPRSGRTSGGTTVVVTGTGLTGATGVTFDGIPGTDVTIDPAGTVISAVAPPHAPGPALVVLTFPAGLRAIGHYEYVAPTIAAVSPARGPGTGGTPVTITGTGFHRVAGVTFDGVPGTNLTVDPDGTALTVVTPPGPAGPVEVRVRMPGADAVTSEGFTYLVVAPTVERVDPVRGDTMGGTTVTLLGRGFRPGRTTITICGRTIPADQVTVAPDGTSLTFRTPACRAGHTTIIVDTPDGVSTGIRFRYVGDDPPPPGPNLPVTGDPVGALVRYSSGAVAAGVVLLLLARRRDDLLPG
ncbi:hypothetical protein C6361_01420 [Plantactinospora sp. BC1]|uniref:IPT/TIG domain-containing protein n=1 Tax=Plantactinospora sp. BC1 TaxID=2108470 RepID=UPI000D17A3C8|nr:IPT/TIG domain-containing protein [Plantactinospora sp. BC1]AVT28376.1 hypothetical protein C6361_01420 [Plantactinospora sp. BC1]